MAEGFFIIKTAHRYAYETLRAERNRINLKKRLSEIFDGIEIVLTYENLWAICALPPQKTPVERARASRKSSKKTPPQPELNAADTEPDLPDMPEQPKTSDTPSGARSSQTRFDEVVGEAARWLGADILLTRKGDTEAESEDDDAAESDALSQEEH